AALRCYRRSGSCLLPYSRRASVSNRSHPVEQLRSCHEVQNAIGLDLSQQRGRQSELDELELRRPVGIGSQRNAASCLRGKPNQIDIEVLAIGIRIDLDCLVQVGGDGEDARPIRGQAEPEIVNAPPWMTENLDVGITQRLEIAFRLI